jgi:hypothetical protein
MNLPLIFGLRRQSVAATALSDGAACAIIEFDLKKRGRACLPPHAKTWRQSGQFMGNYTISGSHLGTMNLGAPACRIRAIKARRRDASAPRKGSGKASTSNNGRISGHEPGDNFVLPMQHKTAQLICWFIERGMACPCDFCFSDWIIGEKRHVTNAGRPCPSKGTPFACP